MSTIIVDDYSDCFDNNNNSKYSNTMMMIMWKQRTEMTMKKLTKGKKGKEPQALISFKLMCLY